MKSKSQDLLEQNNPCAAIGCPSPALYRLKVMYLNKSGWFCSSCRNSLLADGLIIQEEESTANQGSHCNKTDGTRKT